MGLKIATRSFLGGGFKSEKVFNDVVYPYSQSIGLTHTDLTAGLLMMLPPSVSILALIVAITKKADAISDFCRACKNAPKELVLSRGQYTYVHV